MAAKTSEWRPGPTVCRCCLTEGCYKDISTEYFWMGKREVYAEMLSETFNVSIAYSTSGGPNSNSRLICEPCISRLRDASEFKRQVVECERMFMQHLDPGSSSLEVDVLPETVDAQIKLEQVKLEKGHSDDDFEDRHDFDDDDDDLDDQPLTKLASKIPKKENVDILDLLDTTQVTVKRKSTTKIKASPQKKQKTKVKEPVKPTTSSKSKPPEKKKKEPERHIMARRNAEVMLQYATIFPFRLQRRLMVCVYCCETYEDPSEYREHMKRSHDKFTLSTAFAHCARNIGLLLKVDCTEIRCRKCAQEFDNLDDMAQHIYYRHDCKKLRLNYDIGMQPYRINKDNWTCYLCSKKFPSLTKLCKHTTSHYQKYTCDVCGRNYLTNEALKYHVRCLHSGKNQCRRCWKEFDTIEKKKEHLKESKPCWSFCCVHCGDRFNSWELKQKHLVEVHQLPKRTYDCPECGMVFDFRKRFYNHFKLTHTDECFVCPCCGLKFTSKKQMEEHRLGHTGEKQFKCNVCLKSFSREKCLKQHLWIHSETKRFGCLICGKQFAQKVSLKGHMKSHHPNVSIEC